MPLDAVRREGKNLTRERASEPANNIIKTSRASDRRALVFAAGIRGWYAAGTRLVRGWYAAGTRLVRGLYAACTRLVRGWYAAPLWTERTGASARFFCIANIKPTKYNHRLVKEHDHCNYSVQYEDVRTACRPERRQRTCILDRGQGYGDVYLRGRV